jgi:vancomycin resistance protein YoaR
MYEFCEEVNYMDESSNSRRPNRLKKRRSRRKVTTIVISILIVFLTVSTGFVVYNYNDIKHWNNLIYPGVTIENVDLSGKTKAQAKEIVNRVLVKKMENRKINISVGDRNYTLSYSDINGKFSVDDTVNSAYLYGKNFNILKKYKLIKYPEMINYKLKFSYDKESVENLVNKIALEVDKSPVNATITMSGLGFNVTDEQSGAELDKKTLENTLFSKIEEDVDGDINIKASIKTIPASIKSSDLKKIDTLIANFSTEYASVSSDQRANNIVLATKSIDGTVVMPGKEFSFNGVVGERTADKGYQPAPVIVGDKLEDGLGGGICQVSTTLYNAVNLAGLTSTERVHHTLPVHYVDKGMDATVDYGNIDYKFVNNFKYPVYIQGYTSGGKVVFNLYSSSFAKK